MLKGLVGEEFGENRKRNLYWSQLDTVRSAMGEGLDANENDGRGLAPKYLKFSFRRTGALIENLAF